MNISNDKVQKLVTIAKMYYEQNKTQREIAEAMNISRPLISRYLSEAQEFGIVHIEIRSPLEGNNLLLNQIRNIYNIKGGIVVPNGINSNMTDQSIAHAAIDHIRNKKKLSYGIGWGSIVGTIISTLEKEDDNQEIAENICPLVGNSGVFNRNYHSNEMVRVFAQKTGAKPYYWHAPAFVESEQEFLQLKELDNYKNILQAWEHMDVAIVNIGNYPSVPDFATASRFGDKLIKEKAVGRLLCYYFDIDGKIIRSDDDLTLQIPLDNLARVPSVIGICADNVKPKALVGALHTGIFTHLIAPEQLIQGALDYK